MKKIKKYQCKDCNKEYCYMSWAIRHGQKKGHYKFKAINEGEFPYK